MYEESVLGLGEATKAMQAILEQALKEPERPIAVAIVDANGKLVHYARMDRCRALPQQIAFKKAYTAAVMRSDTAALAERFQSMGRNISDFGDPNMLALQGGVLVLRPGDDACLGAIGVSGLSAQEDEDLAKLGIQAMGL